MEKFEELIKWYLSIAEKAPDCAEMVINQAFGALDMYMALYPEKATEASILWADEYYFKFEKLKNQQ